MINDGDFDADDDDEKGNMDDETKRQIPTMVGFCLLVLVTFMRMTTVEYG